jgi:hypothetical protein
VTAAVSDGFHVPGIDEPALRDLYRWNLEVLLVAIRCWPRNGFLQFLDDRSAPRRVTELFDRIALSSENAEHASAISRNNARLSAIREIEAQIIPDADQQVAQIATVLLENQQNQLRKLLVAYHRVRERRAAAIVRAHYRTAVGTVC